MHILLSVLKIIGIVLLVLLAVFIVVLSFVLFAPICYRAEGSYKENTPYAKVRVRFLFPLLQVVFSYGDGAPEGKLKVLGICVRDFFDRGEKKTKKKEKAGKKKKTQKANRDSFSNMDKSQKSSAESTESTENTENTERAESTQNKDLKTNKTKLETEKQTKQTFFDKIKYYISFLKEKILSIFAKIREWKEKGLKLRDKIDDFLNKIKHYKKIWDMDVTQQAFKKSKKSLVRLWKSIKPRKGLLRLHIGTDDPAKTGEICAFFGMIYPFVGNYVMIEPDFEQKIYEGDFFVKGHVTVFVLLRAAWVFLFDKDIKKLKEILSNSD